MTAWTKEDVETMRSMWIDGHSASEIATKLGGVTRSAVLGRVNRMGLLRHDATKPKRIDHLIGRKGAAALAKARAASEAARQPAEASDRPSVARIDKRARQNRGVMILPPNKGSDVVANRIENMAARANPAPNVRVMARSFAPLPGCEPVPFGHRGCRWPVVGEGADLMACGQPRGDGEESYCAAHARASRPAPEAKKKLDRFLKIPTGRRAA